MSVEIITDAEKEEFQSLLLQIDDEYKIQDLLRIELKKINTKINATHLASKNNDQNLKQQLFYVTIKIFDNIFDIIEIYGDDIRGQSNNLLEKNKDFYVIDFKLSKLMQDHVLTKKWLLYIAISNEATGISANRSINFKNNLSNHILNVIPIEKSIDTKVVNVSLVWPSLNYWPLLKLSPIEIDISYYFRSYNPEKNENSTTKLNASVEIGVSKENTYKISTNFSQDKLFEILLENSFHRFDIISNVTQQQITKLQFMVDDTSVVKLEFNSETRELILKANYDLLNILKGYFHKKIVEIQNGHDKVEKSINEIL